MAEVWQAEVDAGAFAVKHERIESVKNWFVITEAAADYYLAHPAEYIDQTYEETYFILESETSTISNPPVGFGEGFPSSSPYAAYYQNIFDSLVDQDAMSFSLDQHWDSGWQYTRKFKGEGGWFLVMEEYYNYYYPYYIAEYIPGDDDDTEAAVLIVPIAATLALLAAFGVSASLTSNSPPSGRRRRKTR